jgi:hypothetical protein
VKPKKTTAFSRTQNVCILPLPSFLPSFLPSLPTSALPLCLPAPLWMGRNRGGEEDKGKGGRGQQDPACVVVPVLAASSHIRTHTVLAYLTLLLLLLLLLLPPPHATHTRARPPVLGGGGGGGFRGW